MKWKLIYLVGSLNTIIERGYACKQTTFMLTAFRDVALGDEVCRAIPLTQIGMISFDIDDGAPPPTCYEINEWAGDDPFLQPIPCDSRRKRSVKQPSLTGVFSRAQVETTRMAYSDHIRGIGPGWNYAEVPGAPGGPNSFTAVGSAVTVICGSNLISNYQCGAAGLGESNNKWTRIAFTIPDVSTNLCVEPYNFSLHIFCSRITS